MSAKAEQPSSVLAHALYYESQGFSVVPCKLDSKAPALPTWMEWQQTRASHATIRAWFAKNLGVGIITGAISRLLVIDVDCKPGKLGEETFDDLIMTYGDLPETWIVQSANGGRHYYFKIPEGFVPKKGSDKLGLHVDLPLFVVAPPTVLQDGKKYLWVNGSSPEDCEIADAPDWLLALVEDKEGGDAQSTTKKNTALNEAPGDTGADPFGRLLDGREQYMRDLVWAYMVDLRQQNPKTPEISGSTQRLIFEQLWPKYQAHVRSRGLSLDAEGRGEAELRRKIKYAAKRWDTRVKRDAEKPRENRTEFKPDEPPVSRPSPERRPLTARPLFPIKGEEIPRRAWIIRGQVLRRHVDLLVAPPGAGKSLFTVQRALVLASGRTWGGFVVEGGPKNVLMINSEDDFDEQQRRLWAAAKLMHIDQEVVRERILTVEDPETVVVARTDSKTKTVTRTPVADEVIELIKAHKSDVTFTDPFAETFEGDENSNSELKWAAILWREIARKTNSAISLVHHTKKYATGLQGDADAARGAGALVGVARIVSTMFSMTEEEAGALGVKPQDRHLYVRHDDAKANLSLITGAARWFEKKTVTLPNAGLGLPGDDVGILEPWTPPGPFEGIDMAKIHRALDAIQAGVLNEKGASTGELYTAHYRKDSKRWAGLVLQECFEQTDDDLAKRQLKIWMEVKPGDETGLLYEVEFSDGKQIRKGLQVDPTKRPGRVL